MSATLSIKDELAKLKPVETDLTVAEARTLAASLRQRWEELGAVQTGAVESGLDASTAELSDLRAKVDDFEYDTRMRLGAVIGFGEVLDDLAGIANASGDPAVNAAVAKVMSKARGIFSKFDLTEISGAGSRFDPQLHEEVSAESAAGQQPGTVLRVVQRGYRYRDDVFRRAQVVVAR
jgi:molecular chaperone GrpE